jgi:uncharacterized protein (DUF1697 family)
VADQGWIAFLRAINLGARNRVPMAELRIVFEQAGARSVQTYIASGNVVFASGERDREALVSTLAAAVQGAFGVPAVVVLRTFDELAAVAAAHPFGADTSHTHVMFLERKLRAPERRSLAELDPAPDRFEVAGANVFLHYPDGVQGSRLSAALIEKRVGVAGTVRTWRTVSRLVEMAEAAAPG